jgi:diguanylate cyclase (GGDEF)-like protein/putative nucleotidyltransferase with HDIG domain
MTNQVLSRRAQVYVAAVAILGLFAIGQSTYELYSVRFGWNWFVLALLTLISGSATVKLPSVPATISISETFVFTSVLLFGAAAGTLTVALDALVISLWLARKGHPFYRLAFNVSALPASLWVAAHIFYRIWNHDPLSLPTSDVLQIKELLRPLIVFTVTYYLLNSWLIAFAISFEKKLSPGRVWRENFAWLSLNYFGGASIAALIVTFTRNIDFAYLAFVLPFLVILYFTFSMSMGRVEDANRHLTELNSLYMSTIETLAMAIDAKDQITHGHIRRVQHYAIGLATALGIKDSAQLKAIEAASLLHDMGKLAVPEYILNKPGSLTAAEFEKMKLHATVGADILSAIDFPYPVVPIVRHHHESWNGTGYPQGLRGTDIPLGARILSVVDCFDALTSDRPYRPRLSDADALKILLDRRGNMYDPLVVDKFLEVHAEIAPPEPDELPTHPGGVLNAIARRLSTTDSGNSDARLEDITASTEEMLVLYDLARGLTGHLDLADAADVISKHIRRIVPASTCVFYIYDPESDELYAAHASGDNATQFSGVRIVRGQRLTGWVAANKQTILNSDPMLDLGEVARVIRPRLRSCLSTPLVSEGNLVGVLTLYSPNKDAFNEDHRRVIEVVSRQVSQTILHAVSFEERRTSSLKDELTGLPNLQHLRRFVSSEMSAAGAQTALSLIFVDVQSLKSINNRFGREAGNRALGQVADAIRKALRGADILFRYGSDEFVVLLTQSDIDAAQSVAARIAERISEQALAPSTSEECRVAVTMGVASAPEDGAAVEELVSAARARAIRAPAPGRPFPPSVH